MLVQYRQQYLHHGNVDTPSFQPLTVHHGDCPLCVTFAAKPGRIFNVKLGVRNMVPAITPKDDTMKDIIFESRQIIFSLVIQVV